MHVTLHDEQLFTYFLDSSAMEMKDLWKKNWDGTLHNIVPIVVVIVMGAPVSILAILRNQFSKVDAFILALSPYWLVSALAVTMSAMTLAIWKIIRQRKLLSQYVIDSEANDGYTFQTHLGVWWRIDLESEFIEDFPYCGCCESRKKLVQIEWHPDEVYQCPTTKTEYKLYDGVPRERADILQQLYSAYFRGLGDRLRQRFGTEYRRLKELHADLSDEQIAERMFAMPPLSIIPKDEMKKILDKHPNPHSALSFIEQNFDHYKKYFKRSKS